MKRIVWVLLVFMGINYASAQDVYTSSGKPGYHKKTKKVKGYDPSKLIIGGGLAAGFDGGYVQAGLSPIVGYRFTDHFAAGVGLGYLYSQIPQYIDPVDPNKVSYIKENIVYPNLWSRYYFYRNIFASGAVEYDLINLKGPGYDNYGNIVNQNASVTNPCLFLGIGAKFPIGGRVSFYGEVLYDVLQGTNSPYAPGFPTIIRFGFAAGI